MNEFIKVHGSEVGRDWQRVQTFYQQSLQLKSFVFPEPLAEKQQQIIYRRLENFDSWQQMVAAGDAREKFAMAGRALGALHQSLSPENSDIVSLHCDFGLVNLAWCRQKKLPVFFDPLPGEFFPYPDYTGDRHYDLGQFISTFFTPRYHRYIVNISPELPENLINAFLGGYQQSCGNILTRKKLLKFAHLTHRRYLILRLNKLFLPLRILVSPMAWWLQKKMEKVIECLIIA